MQKIGRGICRCVFDEILDTVKGQRNFDCQWLRSRFSCTLCCCVSSCTFDSSSGRGCRWPRIGTTNWQQFVDLQLFTKLGQPTNLLTCEFLLQLRRTETHRRIQGPAYFVDTHLGQPCLIACLLHKLLTCLPGLTLDSLELPLHFVWDFQFPEVKVKMWEICWQRRTLTRSSLNLGCFPASNRSSRVGGLRWATLCWTGSTLWSEYLHRSTLHILFKPTSEGLGISLERTWIDRKSPTQPLIIWTL